jgi:hypothetical protein
LLGLLRRPSGRVYLYDLAVLRRKQTCYDKAENLFKEALEGRHQKLDEASTAKSGNFTTQSQLTSSPNITLSVPMRRMLMLKPKAIPINKHCQSDFFCPAGLSVFLLALRL